MTPFEQLRAHPTVAVPLGFAVAEPDAMEHAVTVEPVVGLVPARIRAVPKEAAIQFTRQLALDRQIEGIDLGLDRCVVAPQIEWKVSRRIGGEVVGRGH